MSDTGPEPNHIAAMRSAVMFLFDLADEIDRWAVRSLSGGWSTRHIEANHAIAEACRSEACAILRVLPTTTSEDDQPITRS